MGKRAVAALADLLASGAVACGTVATPGSGPGSGSGGSASPAHTSGSSGPVRPQGGTRSQPAGKPVSLTAAGNGATVRLATGQSITVTLAPPHPFPGTFRLPPEASSTALMHPAVTRSGGRP